MEYLECQKCLQTLFTYWYFLSIQLSDSSQCEMSPWPLALLLWSGPTGWEAFPPLLYLSRTTGSLLWRVIFGVSSWCLSGTRYPPVLGTREETKGKMEPENTGVYQRSEGTCRSWSHLCISVLSPLIFNAWQKSIFCSIKASTWLVYITLSSAAMLPQPFL